MTRAAACCLTSSTSASSSAISSNGRIKRLTTVLICLPLGLITLILLCIFTSTSESAALSSQPSSDRFSHPSFNNPIFNFSGDYPPNPYPHPKSPKVFLKHNGESGMLRPLFNENSAAQNQPEKPQQQQHQQINYSVEDESTNENQNFEPKKEYSKQSTDDYPYSSRSPVSSFENFRTPASAETYRSPASGENYRSPASGENYRSSYSGENFNSRNSFTVPPSAAASDASKSKSTPAVPKFQEKHYLEFLVDQTTFPYVPQPQLQLPSQYHLDTNFSQQPSSPKAKFIFPSSENKYFTKKDQPIPAAASPAPAYIYPYSLYSEEDLENVADFDDHHSKYFIKTKPRVSSGKSISDSLFNPNIKRAIASPFQSPRPSNHFLNQDDVVEHLLPYAKEKSIPSSSLQIHSDEYDDGDSNANFSDNNDVPLRHHKDFGGTPSHSQSNEEDEHENGEEDVELDSQVIPDPTASSTTTTTISTTSTPEKIEPEAKTSAAPQKFSTTTTTVAPALDLSSSASVVSDFSSSTATNNLITDVTSKYGTTDPSSIPGMPGIDYPILDEVPYTGFDCSKQRYKGFFADIDTKCQAWHYCDFTDGHSTFLCPNGTLFSQVLLTCDWWFNVDCKQAQQLYVLNERLYRYIKPPKPSFPEDYSGPQVDRWLIEQLQLGTYPKMKKKTKDKLTQPSNN